MVLHKVAVDYGDQRHDDERRGGVDVQNFYKQLQSRVVYHERAAHAQGVAAQLRPSAQGRTAERDCFLQPKPREEGYGKDDDQRKDVRRDHHQPQIQKTFADNKIMYETVEEPAEYQVNPSARRITERGGRHFAQRPDVEKVDKARYCAG